MRIVFVGFATWGHEALAALLASDHQVELVVTQPPTDDDYYAYLNKDVAKQAVAAGIPVLRTRHLTGDAAATVIDLKADLMVVSNWISRIEARTYNAPRLGTINIHDSLLPQYAGFGAPNWALVNDEKQVGVTVHMMDEGFDTGDIVAQRALDVSATDTATTLVQRSLTLIDPLLREALTARESGKATTPQDRSKATIFHRRREPDYRIDWSDSATNIANLVRAQSDPFPSAFTFLPSPGSEHPQRIEIVEARATTERYGGTAGRVVRDRGRVIVVCGPHSRRGSEPGIEVHAVRTESGELLTVPGEVLRAGAYLG